MFVQQEYHVSANYIEINVSESLSCQEWTNRQLTINTILYVAPFHSVYLTGRERVRWTTTDKQTKALVSIPGVFRADRGWTLGLFQY